MNPETLSFLKTVGSEALDVLEKAIVYEATVFLVVTIIILFFLIGTTALSVLKYKMDQDSIPWEFFATISTCGLALSFIITLVAAGNLITKTKNSKAEAIKQLLHTRR